MKSKKKNLKWFYKKDQLSSSTLDLSHSGSLALRRWVGGRIVWILYPSRKHLTEGGWICCHSINNFKAALSLSTWMTPFVENRRNKFLLEKAFILYSPWVAALFKRTSDMIIFILQKLKSSWGHFMILFFSFLTAFPFFWKILKF